MLRARLLLAGGLVACARAGDGVPPPGADDVVVAETDPSDAVDTDVGSPVDSEPPADSDPGGAHTDAPVDTDDPGPDLRADGPAAIASSSGDFTASSGCVVHWQRFAPDGGSSGPLVVLAHGLERTEQQMTVWARHLATWGLDVVAPRQCHAQVVDLDQEQNAADLVELAAALRPGPVIYAGHSAGGLAAWVAAARDPSAVGLFGLDPTEWLGIGAAADADVHVPTYALLGDSGVCNAFGSGAGLLAGIPGSTGIHVVDADHCDFESPTGPLCTTPCGRSPNTRFSDAEIRATIVGLLTAALLELAGLDPVADTWWTTGGAWHDRLKAEGRIR